MKRTQDGYRIGDLAAMFGITARTVRYYEELGLLKSSDRNEGLHRRYPVRNITWLRRIMTLKSLGLSLGEIKEYFELLERDPSGEGCRALLLGKYEALIAAEEAALEASRRRVEELRARAEELRTRSPFISCPGPDCEGCEASGECEAANR